MERWRLSHGILLVLSTSAESSILEIVMMPVEVKPFTLVYSSGCEGRMANVA